MSVFLIPLLRDWPTIRTDFDANWWIYLSMPFVAAFVGYSTKLLFLQMLYKPLEFKGIGVIGWQGIIPRRAGKVASTTIELLTANLLKPEELLDRFNAAEAIEEMREPMRAMIETLSRDVAEQVRPGLWEALPPGGRRAVLSRMEAQAPAIVDSLIEEMRADLPRYIDLQYLSVTTLVRNKAQLNALMQTVATDAMTFVRRSGIYFGFAIGLLQMVAWGYFHNPWIMPGFGFAVGLISDWLALTMLFRPLRPKRYLGVIRFQGLLHAQRDKITRGYARILAEDLFAPEILFESILRGPSADKLLDTVSREISNAIDRQMGVARPLVRLTVGTARYREFKDKVAATVLANLPATLEMVTPYAERTLDIQGVIVEKMAQLSPEEYEGIMRPVFKDDEPLMIATGAVLGGLVGELQVFIIEHLGK